MKLEILTPAADGFILGRAILGAANLGAPGEPEVWSDVWPISTTITASEGGNSTRLNPPESGHLSATFKDIDPELELWLKPGRLLRLRDETRPDQAPLWYGWTVDPLSTDERDITRTTLTAADPVADLAGATRKGVGSAVALHTLKRRVSDLASSSSVPLSVVGPDTDAVLTGTAVEGPVSDHLSMACDGFAEVGWRADMEGGVEILTTPPAGVVAHLSDAAGAEASYLSLSLSYGTTTVENVLTVKNHVLVSAGEEVETSEVFVNATSIATYRRRPGEVDLCLGPSALPGRAAQILAERAEVEWSPSEVSFRYADLPTLPRRLDRVEITRKGVTWLCVVTGVKHDVTQADGRHTVTLYLRKVPA